MLRRRVSIDDIVGARRTLERGRRRSGRIFDMHEAGDPLTLTDDRNLLLPKLITNIALARVPGARAIEESVPQRDELDFRRHRRARFQFQVSASAGLDPRRSAGNEEIY